jgi:hypothetical protein
MLNWSHPYDKLPLTVTLPANDPLYKVKRGILHASGCGNWVQVCGDEGGGGILHGAGFFVCSSSSTCVTNCMCMCTPAIACTECCQRCC